MKKATTEKYRDLISKSEQTLQQEDLDLQVQSAKSEVEVTLATTKRDLARAKQALEKSKSATPYKPQDEMRCMEEVEAIERGIVFLERILKERF